jgi:hypothetical protein
VFDAAWRIEAGRDALRAGLGRLRRAPAPVEHTEYLPVYFPSRIELRFSDGTAAREQVDLQTGSMAAPTAGAGAAGAAGAAEVE